MNKLLYVLMLAFLVSCLSTGAREDSKTPQTGWIDEDAYTVTATADSEQKAIEEAKYQILKDIVAVRIKNNSGYTDIVKIQGEFDPLFKEGKVISKTDIPNGIRIYFQIRDKGLRNKFQRR
ncbi:MAG: hypothetical protein A2W19_12010 [Spirochaetes bacterium RBG_16_49_21]|nr:MAG: hypothetical protein A2W19_12010 [Spirochaetes bacterium RBG_16_49_21]